MFKIAEMELGMENRIGITLKTGVGDQSAILHVNRCRSSERYTTRLPFSQACYQEKIVSHEQYHYGKSAKFVQIPLYFPAFMSSLMSVCLSVCLCVCLSVFLSISL